jgi:transcriptional regulator
VYVPKLYREEDRETIVAFLRQNNFPALVSFDGTRLAATHLAVEVEATDTGLTIYGHMARSNPQWRTLGAQEALLIFQGPHTYISPRWYDHVNVPTWNYLMVHVYGAVRELQGDDLRGMLSRLVQTHEAASAYRLETLPPEFVEKEMKGVFGFALDVARVEAGYKLSQNRNAGDHANIVTKLDERGDANSAGVAAAMRAQRAKKDRA